MVAYFWLPPAGAIMPDPKIPVNINYVFGFDDAHPQNWLPTHWALRRWLAPRAAAARPALVLVPLETVQVRERVKSRVIFVARYILRGGSGLFFKQLLMRNHPDFPAAADEPATGPAISQSGRRHRLAEAAAATATQLLPLLRLLDTIQPQVCSDSVFHLRRLKIQAHFAEVRQELRAERPRREALLVAIQALSELVREEARDISRDELQQAAKEVVLATLKNAPALINAAHQARLLA